MFDKILIANRGEIACRIMQTAHRLGIATVAVYSDADRHALHVSMADEAIHIGPAPARDSYLLIDRVVDAALKCGAQAIHPGYGFLSENAEFASACADNGLVFIGPSPASIRSMGSKSAAKQIMEQAGVPLVPGYHGDAQDTALLRSSADDMGYPVLLKAVSGGGGKGMRQVWRGEDFAQELEAAQREAQNSFGDARMLVEKYLTQPRHVEVQVFCDQHGNGVYLSERDCSVQRRHQKIIEEAPAPGLSPELRTAMGEAALQAAQAIDYVGAGTVEFLLDSDGAYYFMEMNTRLQVEHPVTEMVTGQDLVEWQLRVAAGELLPTDQSGVEIQGHAFEARIYAEDPNHDFLPATGTLSFLREPRTSSQVRVDTGVRQGDDVSIYYDPMIAKLVVHGQNRTDALRGLARALSEYRIGGVTTNVDFLYALTCNPAFRQAQLDTGFIEQHRQQLFATNLDERTRAEQVALAALYILLARSDQAQQDAAVHTDPGSPWHSNDGWRLNEPHMHRLILEYRDQQISLQAEQLHSDTGAHYTITVNDHDFHIRGSLADEQLHADINGYRQTVTIAATGDHYSAYLTGTTFQFREAALDLGESLTATDLGNPRAPMTGTIVALLTEPGVAVDADSPLLIMEAMKMEHTIRAPAAGQVTEFFCAEGDLVEGSAELLRFEASNAGASDE